MPTGAILRLKVAMTPHCAVALPGQITRSRPWIGVRVGPVGQLDPSW